MAFPVWRIGMDEGRSEARRQMELEVRLAYLTEINKQDKQYGIPISGFNLRSIRIILEKLGTKKLHTYDIYEWSSYLTELRAVIRRQRDEDRNRYHRHYRERLALENRYRESKKPSK